MTRSDLQEIFAPQIQAYLEAVYRYEEEAKYGCPTPMEMEIAQIGVGRALLDFLMVPKARDPLIIFEEESAWRQANSRNVPRRLREAVLERDGGKCRECGSEKDIEIDHVIPYSRGGLTLLENLQPLCQPCNGRKGAR